MFEAQATRAKPLRWEQAWHDAGRQEESLYGWSEWGGGELVFILNGEETLAKISQVVLAVWMDFLTDPDCLDYIS